MSRVGMLSMDKCGALHARQIHCWSSWLKVKTWTSGKKMTKKMTKKETEIFSWVYSIQITFETMTTSLVTCVLKLIKKKKKYKAVAVVSYWFDLYCGPWWPFSEYNCLQYVIFNFILDILTTLFRLPKRCKSDLFSCTTQTDHSREKKQPKLKLRLNLWSACERDIIFILSGCAPRVKRKTYPVPAHRALSAHMLHVCWAHGASKTWMIPHWTRRKGNCQQWLFITGDNSLHINAMVG